MIYSIFRKSANACRFRQGTGPLIFTANVSPTSTQRNVKQQCSWRYYSYSTQRPSVKFSRSKEDASLHFIFSDDDGESGSDDIASVAGRPLILSPFLKMPVDEVHSLSVTSEDTMVQSIMSEIERHYSLEDGSGNTRNGDGEASSSSQFVGGMGENDGGVWFTSSRCRGDTLDYCDEIRAVIQQTKQSRHGVPFGIYTSGWINDDEMLEGVKSNLSELGLSSIVVSLLSDNPVGYGKLLQLSDPTEAQRRFGQVCGFLATMSESGLPMTAAVAGGRHAGGGSDLAKALGAVDVIIYDDVM